MVFVDVFVPSVDKTYNFNLNENVSIGEVILEITEMIEQKERTKLVGEKDDLNLYEMKQAEILPKSNSLFDCYITSGSRLILV
ncbi:hypothetical protein [Oribacterium sp. NK2B42]|uniref:hypothetical protein n=1 Tax=Oribacterium sp. NK2B42 TaxID=689781 RepID=UPI0003FFC1EA|nr:hypothetical protein [Oribacterium sp. NK2B42]